MCVGAWGFPRGSPSTFVLSLSVSPSLPLQCLVWVQNRLSGLGCDQMTNSQSPGRRAEGRGELPRAPRSAVLAGEAQRSLSSVCPSQSASKPPHPVSKLLLDRNVTCPSSGRNGRDHPIEARNQVTGCDSLVMVDVVNPRDPFHVPYESLRCGSEVVCAELCGKWRTRVLLPPSQRAPSCAVKSVNTEHLQGPGTV